jgi:hypothetical protein
MNAARTPTLEPVWARALPVTSGTTVASVVLVALAMLNAAYGRGSGGHIGGASDGRSPLGGASPTHRSEGHSAGAAKATPRLPAAAPRPMPGHAKRGAVAIAAVQPTIARSLFDSTILPDGRRLREVRWSEAPTLAAKWGRAVRIVMAIHNYAIPPDPSATLDQIVSEEELSKIISAVERLNGIH